LNDKQSDRISFFFLLIVLAMLGALVGSDAFATERRTSTSQQQGQEQGQQMSQGQTLINTPTQTLNQTVSPIQDSSQSIGGSKAYALGMGAVEVAIAECVASESWAFLILQRQVIVENNWCIGANLYRMGLTNAAARIWCDTTRLGSLYPDGDCVANLDPPAPAVSQEEPEPKSISLSDGLSGALANLQHSLDQQEDQAGMMTDLAAKLSVLERENRRLAQSLDEVDRNQAARAAAAAESLDRLAQYSEGQQ